MSWNNQDLTQIFQAIDNEFQAVSGTDGGGAMQTQIEAWSKMQELFTWQHQNLTNHRKALAAKWSSGGGAAYLEQVDNVITTLSSAAAISYGNMTALSNMKQSLDKHHPIIKQAYEEYQKDWQQQLADYSKKKHQYDTAKGTAWVKGDGPTTRPPKEPDLGEITKPYLERARKAANTLSNDYASNNSLLLAYPPKYKGPHSSAEPGPPGAGANGLVSGGLAATAVAPFVVPDHPRTGSRATTTPPTQVPSAGDPGPVLAGGPSAPVLPGNSPVTSPPLSPGGGGGFPSSGLPIGAPIPPRGLGGGFTTGGRPPGGLRDGMPTDNEFLPRGRTTSPSVLGRNGSKFSVDRTARERYGLPREEPGGTSGRTSGRVLGQRTNKFAPKERAEPVSRRVIEPGEPTSEPEPRSGVLGAEERTPPTRTPPAARQTVRDTVPDEAAGGRVLGSNNPGGVLEPERARRRPPRERSSDINGDESWSVVHEGDGVIATEDGADAPTDSGPAIGHSPTQQSFNDWSGRG